jgi:5-oxoprolinase (ATP-hydrolysing) subunit A
MGKKAIDLNSDMGEGFGPWRIADGVDEQIMPLISSANVATGFHAGDPNIMNRMVQLAMRNGVSIGAHPAYRDLVGFGRRYMTGSEQEFVNDIVYQLGALREFARLNGAELTHIKLHGALYMQAARDEALSRAYVTALRATGPQLYVYCMERSATYAIARSMGQPVVREFYGDRDYDTSGSIVFTRRGDRLDRKQVAARAVRACVEGKVGTVEGVDIDIEFDSICIHSDTPGALELISATREALTGAGIRICPVGEVLATYH